MNRRDPPQCRDYKHIPAFFFLTYRVSEARHLKKLHPVPFSPLPRRLRTPWGQITYLTHFCDSEVRGSTQCRPIRVASGFVNPSLPTLRPALLSHWLLTASPKPASLLLWETVLLEVEAGQRGTHQGSFQARGIVISPSHHQE